MVVLNRFQQGMGRFGDGLAILMQKDDSDNMRETRRLDEGCNNRLTLERRLPDEA
jgi:hypothetical protein